MRVSKAKQKFDTVMHEFKEGRLASSSGAKVTDKEQALAIAFSAARDIDPSYEQGRRTTLTGKRLRRK